MYRIRAIQQALFAVAFGLAAASVAWGQNAGNNNGGGNNNNGGGGGGIGNLFGAAGVVVSPEGVLKIQRFDDPRGALTLRRLAEAKANLPGKLAAGSPMRKFSLNRLEAALAQRLANGMGPTDEMKNLAGITKLQYVFVYPDSGDIVIAGPAEGYFEDVSGRAIGLNSGRAVLQLQDLVAALRAYPPKGQDARVIGCSIDATQQGLANLQKYLGSFGGRMQTGAQMGIVRGMEQALGKQVVTIDGVSPQTHLAQVMVEADYRMKLIGIGLEIPQAKIPSYVSLATGSSISANAMQRWYFTPNYECLRVTEDKLGMEMVGEGVKLIGADELVAANGQRVASNVKNKASEQYCAQFTANYEQLAKRSPVYAQLKNVIDVVIAAAFIKSEDYYGKTNWNAAVFRDEKQYSIENLQSPKMVDTACNAVQKGSRWTFPIGGGVQIEPHTALQSQYQLKDEGDKVKALHGKTAVSGLADGQWWWD